MGGIFKYYCIIPFHMQNVEELDCLSETVLVPPLLLDDFFYGTNEAESIGGISRSEYLTQLDKFAFDPKRDYEGFRKFLHSNLVLFKNQSTRLEQMNYDTIDYVLERVKKERSGNLYERTKQKIPPAIHLN